MADKKNPARVKAGEKAARTRKRNATVTKRPRKSGTAITARRRTATRRRTRKRGLSDVFSPAIVRGGAGTVIAGALGGYLTAPAEKFMPKDWNDSQRGLAKIVGGFLTATVLGMPNIGAGMAGAGAAELAKSRDPLSEIFDMDGDVYADPEILQSYPTYMNDGPFELSQSEFELSAHTSPYDWEPGVNYHYQ